MKKFLFLLVMLLATVAGAQQTIQSGPAPNGLPGAVVDITSNVNTGVYYVAPAEINNTITLQYGSTLAGTLYHCALISADTNSDGAVDAAAKCTSIMSLSAGSTVSLANPSRFIIIDIDTKETAGTPSYLTIRGSKGVQNQINQATPSLAATLWGDNAVISDPFSTRFGMSFDLEQNPTTSFNADTYPTAGDNGDQPDHNFGWSINKTINGNSLLNPHTTGADFSVEAFYRSTANTADETWIEYNWDFFSPDFTTTTTGGGVAAFAAGDRFSCSGGGSGYVVSYPSQNNLTYRADYGVCAAGQTITVRYPATGRVGNTAVLGTLNPVALASTQFRPFIFVYKTLQKQAAFDFTTDPGNNTVSISAGYLRHHSRIVPGTVAAGTSNFRNTAIGAGACATLVTTAATGALTSDTIRWSYASAPTLSTSLLTVNAYATAGNVNFSVCNPTAGSLTPATITVNWLVDRWL